MRVKPPADGPPAAAPVEGAPEAAATDGVGQVAGAGSAEGAQAVQPAESARGATAADPVTEVARRLRAGEIAPREAVELLIDDAVARQVGRATADRQALAAELKELLRRYTETDPYLAAKVRRLGTAK